MKSLFPEPSNCEIFLEKNDALVKPPILLNFSYLPVNGYDKNPELSCITFSSNNPLETESISTEPVVMIGIYQSQRLDITTNLECSEMSLSNMQYLTETETMP